MGFVAVEEYNGTSKYTLVSSGDKIGNIINNYLA